MNTSPNLSHCLFSWASVTIYLTADSKEAPTNYINVVVSNRSTHFFSLKDLEAGSSKISFSGLKSAIGRTSLPPDALGRICYLPLPASGGCWLIFTLPSSNVSLTASFHTALSSAVFISNFAQPLIGH